jgi:hypothetical protein
MAEQVSTQDWNEMLKKHSEAFNKAQVSNNWMPPDGEGYHGKLVGLRTGFTKPKNGKPSVPYWSVEVEMLDGVDAEGNELEGRTFSEFFGAFDNTVGIFKSFVSTLAGTVLNDLETADELLRMNVENNAVIRFTIKTNEKSGYKNFYLEEVVESGVSE